MIRFILKRKTSSRHSGLETEDFETLDVECGLLQAALQRGGHGMDEYDHTELVGVEILNGRDI